MYIQTLSSFSVKIDVEAKSICPQLIQRIFSYLETKSWFKLK